MSKELVKQEQNLPAVYDFGEDSGVGFETISASDLAIPFLNVLQSSSPQVAENKPQNSRPGLLFNSVTEELSSGENGVVLLPAYIHETFVEWVPREKGGGLVTLYEPDSAFVLAVKRSPGFGKKPKFELPNGNHLVETHYVYCLILDETATQTTGFCVIAFNSTKLTPLKHWKTNMFMIKGRPPIFSFRSVLKTVKQQNEKGIFYNFSIQPFGKTWGESIINPQTERTLLEEAKNFRAMVLSGSAKAAFETQESYTEAGSTESYPDEGEKPPF